MDLGPPVSYLVLDKGTPVFSSDGEKVGAVTHVLADEAEDVFDGVVIEEHWGKSGHRFVDADQIAEIHEGGVVLKLDAAAAQQLPKPSPNPAVIRDDPTDAGTSLGQKLRRAWDHISGNY